MRAMGQADSRPLAVRGISTMVFLVVLHVAAFATESPASNSHALDGLQFSGQTGEKDKGDHHSDTITFDGGMFRSLDCENWGFGPAPYSVHKDGEKHVFRAVLRSADRGTLEWQGVITGDRAIATFHWRHERWYWNIDRHYWFEGTRTEK